MSATGARLDDAVAWHDVECGSYGADLEAWDELAAGCTGSILELGAGTGRVALRLTRSGHEVCAVERDGALAAALAERAGHSGLPVEVVVADLADLHLGRRFELVIGPMQLLQVLGGRRQRAAALSAVARHLSPNGVAALALIEGVPSAGAEDAGEELADIREIDGCVYSSLPLETSVDSGAIRVRRLRQRVSSTGELREGVHVDRLDLLDAAALVAEASEAGLYPLGRRSVDATDAHLGATIALLGRGP